MTVVVMATAVLKGKKEGEINKRVDGRRTLNLM
jgi:hypothetical protein